MCLKIHICSKFIKENFEVRNSDNWWEKGHMSCLKASKLIRSTKPGRAKPKGKAKGKGQSQRQSQRAKNVTKFKTSIKKDGAIPICTAPPEQKLVIGKPPYHSIFLMNVTK